MSAGFWADLPPRERDAKSMAHRQQAGRMVWGCGCGVCMRAAWAEETCAGAQERSRKPGRMLTGAPR